MVGTQEIWVDWLNDNSLSQCLNWGALGYDGVTKKLPDLNGLTQQRFSFGSNGPVKLGRYSPSCSCILSNHPSLLKCVLWYSNTIQLLVWNEEFQILPSPPRPAAGATFNKTPRWFVCTLQFVNHHSRPVGSKVTLEKRDGEGTLALHWLKPEVMMLISSARISLARTSHVTPTWQQGKLGNVTFLCGPWRGIRVRSRWHILCHSVWGSGTQTSVAFDFAHFCFEVAFLFFQTWARPNTWESRKCLWKVKLGKHPFSSGSSIWEPGTSVCSCKDEASFSHSQLVSFLPAFLLCVQRTSACQARARSWRDWRVWWGGLCE